MITLKIGDSVKVCPGVCDPDFGEDIGGWQGRVSKPPKDGVVCIEWDSVTLKSFSAAYIKKCEEEGWDWEQISLDISDVERTEPRDSEKDVQIVLASIQNRYAWSSFGEQGERIHEVLVGIAPEEEEEAFAAWENYLKDALKFPFEAIVYEVQERGPVKEGNEVLVHHLSGTDDLYGILAAIEFKRNRFTFPLADLKIKDKKSESANALDDYCVWFANH
jgi:hypothetical protein